MLKRRYNKGKGRQYRLDVMIRQNETDWNSALELLSTIPQKHHAAYLAQLAGTKQEVQLGLNDLKPRSESLKKRVASKVKKTRKKPRRTSSSDKFTYNKVECTPKEMIVFQGARGLIEQGVAVNTTELAAWIGCREMRQGSVQSTMVSLRLKGLLDWDSVNENGMMTSMENLRLGPKG